MTISKKYKKIIALCMIVFALGIVLAACGEPEEDVDPLGEEEFEEFEEEEELDEEWDFEDDEEYEDDEWDEDEDVDLDPDDMGW